jgi:hypothetical protein
MSKIALPNSPVASQPCPSGRITMDKRENFILAKLPSATSFIRKPLYEMLIMVINNSNG